MAEDDKAFAGKIPTYAPYSDDTQLFRAVLDALLRARPTKAADIDRTAEEVAEELIAWVDGRDTAWRAPGHSCLQGARALKNGTPWRQAGVPGSTGCGSAMRSMAYGIWFWNTPEIAAQFAAMHAHLTHRSASAQASAAAVAAGTAAGIMGFSPADIAHVMRNIANNYDTECADLITSAMALALDGRTKAEAVLAMWKGWQGHEAVAAALYCFLRAPTNYKATVLTAVNVDGDSDSIGAIAGALAGAHLGVGGIPSNWKERVEKSNELAAYAGLIIRAKGYENVEVVR